MQIVVVKVENLQFLKLPQALWDGLHGTSELNSCA